MKRIIAILLILGVPFWVTGAVIANFAFPIIAWGIETWRDAKWAVGLSVAKAVDLWISDKK